MENKGGRGRKKMGGGGEGRIKKGRGGGEVKILSPM